MLVLSVFFLSHIVLQSVKELQLISVVCLPLKFWRANDFNAKISCIYLIVQQAFETTIFRSRYTKKNLLVDHPTFVTIKNSTVRIAFIVYHTRKRQCFIVIFMVTVFDDGPMKISVCNDIPM